MNLGEERAVVFHALVRCHLSFLRKEAKSSFQNGYFLLLNSFSLVYSTSRSSV
jgi:hypothetical protein